MFNLTKMKNYEPIGEIIILKWWPFSVVLTFILQLLVNCAFTKKSQKQLVSLPLIYLVLG